MCYISVSSIQESDRLWLCSPAGCAILNLAFVCGGGEGCARAVHGQARICGAADGPSVQQGSSGQASQAPVRHRVLTKLEREASRRLLRQATAANNAQVKGHCLMVMQMLTRREVLKSHSTWQLMTKHAMWMALEYRRSLDGLHTRTGEVTAPVTLLEATAAAEIDDGRASDCSDGEARDDIADMLNEDGDGGTDPEELTASTVNVKVRRRNDTYYDDYLHRGAEEDNGTGQCRRTPFGDINYYEYGMYVRVVPGSPWNQLQNQYAFDQHHTKFESHVQQLRKSPAVPYVHGFTMPTKAKDPETNACFKQILLRPHRCHGQTIVWHVMRRATSAISGWCGWHCVTSTAFLKEMPLADRGVSRNMRQWRAFESLQFSLAQSADTKIHASRRYPVLADVALLRSWCLRGANPFGFVHRRVVPLLCNVLPPDSIWTVLRFAGHLRDDDGCVVGIANTAE